MHLVPHAEVIAPEHHPAAWAAADLLALAAGRGDHMGFHHTPHDGDTPGLDDGIEREGRSCPPLAPGAMAAVHKHRPVLQAVDYFAAGAAAAVGTNPGKSTRQVESDS